jgi:hypothetical protein
VCTDIVYAESPLCKDFPVLALSHSVIVGSLVAKQMALFPRVKCLHSIVHRLPTSVSVAPARRSRAMSSEGGQAIGPREGRLGLTLTKAAAQMCCRTLVFSPRPDEHECKSCGQSRERKHTIRALRMSAFWLAQKSA